MKPLLILATAVGLLAGCGPQTINDGSGSGTGAGSGVPSGEFQGTASSSSPDSSKVNTGDSSSPTGTNTFGTVPRNPEVTQPPKPEGL